MKSVVPFAVTKSLEPGLARVLDHWDALKRGANDIPFADDMKICSVPALAGELMLLHVYAKPERFRIDYLAEDIVGDGRGAAPGRFIDEITLGGPFDYLRAQASATVERGAPSLYRHDGEEPYARLLLPLWADGHIAMLLGAVERAGD